MAEENAEGGEASKEAGGKKKGHGGKKKHGGGHGGGGHGEGVNLERWLVSYADFMTLLFCVFTVLYATSISNKSASQGASDAKLQEIAKAVMASLASSGPYPSKIEDASDLDRGNIFEGSRGVLDMAGTEILQDMFNKKVHHREGKKSQSSAATQASETVTEIKTAMTQILGAEKAKDIKVSVVPNLGVRVTLPDRVTFDSGDANINPVLHPVLDSIGKTILRLGKNVIIEGHTDDIPIQSERYASNWELSVARSSSILHYLLSNNDNLIAEKFSAAGYGEHHPIVPNNSAVNREKNRRVEIVITWPLDEQQTP